MRHDIYAQTFELEESYWWYVARRAIMLEFIDALAPREVLDYGCGTGKLMAVLSERGYGVTGADQSDEALRFCRQRGLSRLIDLKTEAVPQGGFDLVVMGDVLEHLPEEQPLLESLDGALRPGGKLLVTVPAYDWLWSGEDIVSEHKRRYTLPTLEAALAKGGFVPLKSTYFNTLLLPLVTAAIWLGKLKPGQHEPESDLKPLPSWINEPLRRIFSLEQNILRRTVLPFGASILVVAERAVDSSAERAVDSSAERAVSSGAARH
jgi:2-polyprenyl-3-methyl-5-hydroxy-6-metoxy-1,4-benzoquinol methylase